MDNIYSKRVLSFDEGVQLLGIAKSTVYKMTSAGLIPFSKPNGKLIYFDREKLENWMLSNANEPKKHLEETKLNQKVIELNQKVIELKRQGRSLREIGVELSISHSKVKRIFDKFKHTVTN
jgi:excisionase family DNA binding protein